MAEGMQKGWRGPEVSRAGGEEPTSVCPGLSCFPGRGPSRGNRENQDEEVTCVELKNKRKK